MLTVSFPSSLVRLLITTICALQRVHMMAFPGAQQRQMMTGSIWLDTGDTVQMDARLKVKLGAFFYFHTVIINSFPKANVIQGLIITI